MARHGGGAGTLGRGGSLERCSLVPPGDGSGYPAFLELPSGTVGDPVLALFLHPAGAGSGGKVLRLQGVVTAME
jgi:hypothetical protein